MVAFIVLFFPAVLSLWIWEAAGKRTASRKKWVYLYVLNTIIINFGCFAIKKWLLHTGEYSLENMSPSAAVNYLIMAVSLAIVLALVEIFPYKQVRLSIEPNTKDGKNNDKN